MQKPVDMYIVGLPCQPFSLMGVRRGWKDKRISQTYRATIKTLKENRGCVRSVLLENVQGLLSHDKGRSLARVLRDLESCDFKVCWRKYLSSDFGLPQRRPRVYILGLHKSVQGKPRLPRPPCIECPPISQFLLPDKGPRDAAPSACADSHASRNLRNVVKHIQRQGRDPCSEDWVIDIEPPASAEPPYTMA